MMSAAATKTKPRVMSRGGIIACTVLTLLTPVGLLLIHLARGNAEEVEHLYSRGFYHGMATVLTALTGRAASTAGRSAPRIRSTASRLRTGPPM